MEARQKRRAGPGAQTEQGSDSSSDVTRIDVTHSDA